jgi:hypothetical protein
MSAAASSGDTSAVKIFINYRRDDTQGTAWALYMKLEERFGADNVFFDNRALLPGMRWLQEIRTKLASSGVFVALIGQSWLPILREHMQRGDEDYVAKEIDLALRDPRMLVIPVLVDDTALPNPSELPPSLRMLVDCQLGRLRHTELAEDVDRLITLLGNGLGLAERSGRAEPPDEPEPAAMPAPQPVGRAPGPVGRRPIAPAPDDDHYRMVARHLANMVIFIGAGANADHDQPWMPGSGTLPDDADLTKYLASRVGLKDRPLHLAEVAQYAGAVYGEVELFGWISQVLKVDSQPTPVHRYLARLPRHVGDRYQLIVTPKFDDALEKAFKDADEDFDLAVYMAPGTEQAGRFVHLPWGEMPRPIDKPNEYTGFPIVAEDRSLRRTVIVRISGSVDDPLAGCPWEDNYVITEDHYIDYLNGRSAEESVPAQLLAKLRRANYLFLGYTIADWRLRVFLQRIWKGARFGRAKYWAVEQAPDILERDLWQQAGVTLYQCGLTDYLKGLENYLAEHPDEARP